ncbi:MAG: hypothetical protein MK089_02645 [Phycisphaerales bacterium]|nr:hypothetical protein [Phycisphaerales bacterium]
MTPLAKGPLPEVGQAEPMGSEIMLLIIGGIFTLIVAGFLIVMVVRYQLRERNK